LICEPWLWGLYLSSPLKDFTSFIRGSHSTVVMVRAVVVGNRVRVSAVTVLPVKLSVNLSERWEGKGIASFERFLSFNDVSISDKRSSIRRGGTVAHLSG